MAWEGPWHAQLPFRSPWLEQLLIWDQSSTVRRVARGERGIPGARPINIRISGNSQLRDCPFVYRRDGLLSPWLPRRRIKLLRFNPPDQPRNHTPLAEGAVSPPITYTPLDMHDVNKHDTTPSNTHTRQRLHNAALRPARHSASSSVNRLTLLTSL